MLEVKRRSAEPDNRKCNLRICTRRENSRNQRVREGTASKYKGVSFEKKTKVFNAKITCNGRGINLGRFKDEIDAARAYDAKARELFGEFAYLNFPNGLPSVASCEGGSF